MPPRVPPRVLMTILDKLLKGQRVYTSTLMVGKKKKIKIQHLNKMNT